MGRNRTDKSLPPADKLDGIYSFCSDKSIIVHLDFRVLRVEEEGEGEERIPALSTDQVIFSTSRLECFSLYS